MVGSGTGSGALELSVSEEDIRPFRSSERSPLIESALPDAVVSARTRKRKKHVVRVFLDIDALGCLHDMG